jgi:hypothetical protein
MKCPKCGGEGKYLKKERGTYDFCYKVELSLCDMCHGSGEVEITNEEWLNTLPTEEKAKFLVMIEMSAMHPVKRGSIDTKKFIEDVTEWLKQPHKE